MIAPMVYLFGVSEEIKAISYLLKSGVDGEGSILFQYEGMEANAIYSKITNSYLPTEIQGEEERMMIDHIKQLASIKIQYRNGQVEQLANSQDESKMVYEINGFFNTILSNKTEAKINSFQFSTNVMKILDEVRHQAGIIYPAD